MAVENLYGRIVSTLKSISSTELTVNSEFKQTDSSNMDIPSEGYLTIGNADDLAPSDIGEPPTYEKVKYTSFNRNGDGTTTFSGLSRAQGNTEAVSWSSGVDVGLSFSPETLTRVLSNLFTDEKAQDAVGTIMQSGAGVATVNYDDSAPSIKIEVLEGDISHDNITGKSASDHHQAHTHPGDRQATADVTDDQGNTIYSYANQEVPVGVIPLSDLTWSSLPISQSDVSASDVDLGNVLNKAQLAKDGSENLTGDLSDDQGNTLWDYVSQYIPDAVLQKTWGADRDAGGHILSNVVLDGEYGVRWDQSNSSPDLTRLGSAEGLSAGVAFDSIYP